VPATILVVEDDESTRYLIRHLLEKEGYRVLDAVDGAAALEVANRYTDPIELVVTDMAMPGVDGLKLTRLLRTQRPELKLLCMSAYPIEQSRASLDGLWFLSKPFMPEDMLRAVRDALGD